MPSRSALAHSIRRADSPLQSVPPDYQPPHRGGRRLHPADVAQSQLFEELLLDELDALEELLAAAERRRRRRRDESPDDPIAVPHALQQLRERIKETRRMLDALGERFPQD